MLPEPNLPVKPNICCGYPTDTGESVSSILGEEEALSDPRVGDFAICLNCGTWLVYMNEQNDMRLAQPRDTVVLDAENLRRFKKLRKYIRRRGRFWPRRRAGGRFHPN